MKKILIEVTLDDSWDEYDGINNELLIEDLFPIEQRKDGVLKIEVSPLARLLSLVKDMRDCQRRLDRIVDRNMTEDEFDNIDITLEKERQVDILLQKIDRSYIIDHSKDGKIYH